jgi:hypothetical protein
MPETPNKQFDPNFEGGRSERDRRLAELAQRTPAQRRAQLETRQDEPVRCEACGSTWFAAITFAQYRSSTYSSVPGGDLEKMSAADPVIRVCMCGMPVAPNIGGANIGHRKANEDLMSFDASLQGSLDVLRKSFTQAIDVGQIQGVVEKLMPALLPQGLATSADLKHAIAEFRTEVRWLINQKTAPAKRGRPPGSKKDKDEPKKGESGIQSSCETQNT